MITKFVGIGEFPGNKIFIKNNEGKIIASTLVSLDCTFEIDISQLSLSTLLYIVEMDKNNHLVNTSCIKFPISA